MTCSPFFSISSIADFLVWPVTCNYYFWLIIMLVLIFLVSWRLFKSEEKKTGQGDYLGSLTVSLIGFTILGYFGTLVKNSLNIPMISADVMLYFLAATIVFILIWIFKSRD